MAAAKAAKDFTMKEELEFDPEEFKDFFNAMEFLGFNATKLRAFILAEFDKVSNATLNLTEKNSGKLVREILSVWAKRGTSLFFSDKKKTTIGKKGKDYLVALIAVSKMTKTATDKVNSITPGRMVACFPITAAMAMNSKMSKPYVVRPDVPRALSFPSSVSIVPRDAKYDNLRLALLAWCTDFDVLINKEKADKKNVQKYFELSANSDLVPEDQREAFFTKMINANAEGFDQYA